MIEPLTLVLEFLRTENVDDPYAFRFARQTYSLRRGGGSYEKAEIAWDQALLDTLDAVRRPGRSALVVQTLGESLSGFLSGTQWALYDEQIRAASAEKREILLIFRSAAAELYALPWELLALKKSGLQLGAVPNLLVRYEWPEADVRPPSAAATQEGGRILLAWSGQVPVDEHIAAIETAANAAYYPFQRETDILPHVSAASLRQVLTAAQKDGPPITVLHLLCHGAADADGKTFGLLISSNEADTAVIIDAGSLRALLAPFADMVRLVVLSACDSGNMGALGNQLGSIAQGLHRVGIASVIASRFPLSIKGANELTKSLYHSLLVESLSLEQSLRLGRQKLVENPAELDWASIQCFARADAGSDTRPLVIRPYRGLLPFQPEHQRFFFGRDEELGHLVKLQDDLVQAGKPRLIMVLGTAGTGKSSLVLAGLVPRLLATRPQLAVARMRPSGDPEAMLESQLADLRDSHAVDGQPGELGAVLLVIDQFEALFTDVSDASRRQAFMERLWALASDPKGSVQVLIALRIEQLARCAELMLDGSHQRLDSLAGSPAHRYLLNRVDPKYFKDIIEKPAQVVGLRLEDGLVERLLADASEMAGAQPLLEDILDVLWQHRRGNLLTQAAYDALGGLSGALEGRAEKLVTSFDADELRVARRLFVRLVSASQDMALLTRRCVPVETLRPEDPKENERFLRVLSRLIEARLLISSEEEVAADAGDAPSTRSDGLRVSNRIPASLPLLRSVVSGQYRPVPGSKPPQGDVLTVSSVMHGVRLGGKAVVRSAPGVRPTASLVEVAHEALIHKWKRLRDWLHDDRTMLAEVEKFESWVKQWKETQTLLVGHQLDYAAEVARRYPDDLPRGASELLTQSTRRSHRHRLWQKISYAAFFLAVLGLIFATYSSYRSSRRAKHAATQARDALRVMSASENLGDPVTRVHMLRAVEAENPLSVHGWLRLTTETLHDLLPATLEMTVGHGEEIIGISADCQKIVTSRADEIVRVYDVGNNSPVYTHSGHRDRINTASLSHDDELVLTAANDSTARIFKLATAEEPIILHGNPASGAVVAAHFGQDSQQVATIAEDGSVRLYKADGSKVTELPLARTGAVRSLDYSPDGSRLVTGASDGTVHLLDHLGQDLDQVGVGAKVLSVAFSQDGSEIIIASDDQRVRIFKTAALSAPPVALLSPTQGLANTQTLGLAGAILSPDGLFVLSIHGSQARLQSRHGATRAAILSGPSEPLVRAGFCADGQRLYTIWRGGRLLLWQQSHRRFEVALNVLPIVDVTTMQFSPDGRRLALAAADRLTQVWNADGSGTPLVLEGHRGSITAMAWSTDNFTLATASEDETVGLWRDDQSSPHRFLRGHRGAVTRVVFSPDGTLLASAGVDRQVLLWNVDSHRDTPTPLAVALGQVLKLEFSNDGHKLIVLAAGATASAPKTLELYGTDRPAAPDVLFQGPLSDASFSPDGQKVVGVLQDGTLRVWPVDGPSGVSTFRVASAEPLLYASFSPDSRKLVASSRRNIFLFDPAKPELPVTTFAPYPPEKNRKVKPQSVQALLPIADNKRLIAVFDHSVYLSDLGGQGALSIDTSLVGETHLTTLSPAGGAFVSVDVTGTPWLFNTELQPERLELALMLRLWLASRRCDNPKSASRPAGADDRLGSLAVNSTTCELMQRCLNPHKDGDPLPACYQRLRQLHVLGYE